MSNGQIKTESEKAKEKLDEIIQKKKEEIAGLQHLLRSLENPTQPESDQLTEQGKKDNNAKTNE